MISIQRVAARRAIGGSQFSTLSVNETSYSIRASRFSSSLPCQHQPCLSLRRTNSPTASSKTSTAKTRPYSASATGKLHSPITPPSETPSASISEHVRLLMRRVPYPVAIITATDPTGSADTSSFRGMTVSSFNTVTLSPTPIISFNVRRPSETLTALLASGRFLVHLLAPGPESATLARDFSKGNTTLPAMLSGHGDFEFGALEVDSQGEDESRPLPLLRRRENRGKEGMVDFPFVFECVLLPQQIHVHDHSIVLGSVVRVVEGERVDGDEADRLCLSYADTKFWKMGKQI